MPKNVTLWPQTGATVTAVQQDNGELRINISEYGVTKSQFLPFNEDIVVMVDKTTGNMFSFPVQIDSPEWELVGVFNKPSVDEIA
jgi:hypothetical protein